MLSRPIAERLRGPRWLRETLAVTAAAQVGVAPVLIPVFGWFALLHKDRVRLTIDIAETDRGTRLVASGVAPLALRRTFAELEN